MNTSIKVLQIQNRYNVNASDLAEQVIQGLPSDSYEVTTAFLRGHPGPDEPVSRAPRSVYFNFRQADLKGLRLRALWRLYRFCRHEKFDVVIAHRFKPMNLFMLLNRLLRLRACIGVQHGIGDFDRYYRRIESRLLLTPCWRIVGVSRAVRDYLLNCAGGFHSSNTVQINNAIDIRRSEALQHSREQARALLGLPTQAFIFGSIGRLVPVKGHIHLLQAFAQLGDAYPLAELAIIGEGRSRAELEAAIKEHGLGGRVHLLGAREDALQYVKAFDVFVMPSLSEGLPLALLEGMSGHLPVIGSDIDSLRSILQDCGGGIFPVGNATALAQRMTELLDLPAALLHQQGELAYAYLCREHAIEDFRWQYRQLIEATLKQQEKRV